MKHITLFITLLLFRSICLAQGSTQTALPPGAIDGAVTPNLIPDVVAFRMFFVAVAETPAPGVIVSAKQQAKLNPIGLSAADQSIIVQELVQFKAALTFINSGVQNATGAATPDTLTQSLIDRLKSEMTAGAFQRLQAHVQSEKRRMKVFPVPSMPGHH
jgi:hypothetical protein